MAAASRDSNARGLSSRLGPRLSVTTNEPISASAYRPARYPNPPVSNVKFLTDVPRTLADVGSAARRMMKRRAHLIIRSPAGEFPMTIDRFDVENGELIIVGRMGVWDARTHVGAGEFLRLLGKLFLSPTVLLYAVKAPFLAFRGTQGPRQ
jgi:hypothetical protein